MEKEDYIGKRYGHWKIISYSHSTPSGHSYYKCLCDCGVQKCVRLSKLISGESKSCGCKRRENYDKGGSKNGKRTKLYRVWLGIRDRCKNPRNISYERYGAKGVTLCEEWEDFSVFRNWAESNGYRKGLSIDRIDNNIGYRADNCRWVDTYTQANNTRKNLYINACGKTLTVAQWAKALNIKYGYFYNALKTEKGRKKLLRYFPDTEEKELIPFKKNHGILPLIEQN